jgi:hypothetical protein
MPMNLRLLNHGEFYPLELDNGCDGELGLSP